jgi:hypothetical protein
MAQRWRGQVALKEPRHVKTEEEIGEGFGHCDAGIARKMLGCGHQARRPYRHKRKAFRTPLRHESRRKRLPGDITGGWRQRRPCLRHNQRHLVAAVTQQPRQVEGCIIRVNLVLGDMLSQVADANLALGDVLSQVADANLALGDMLSQVADANLALDQRDPHAGGGL